MRFKDARIGEWLLVDGDVICKVAMLNGANAFDLTTARLAYIEQFAECDYTSSPIHPELKHRVNPSLRTLRLWGDHTWTED